MSSNAGYYVPHGTNWPILLTIGLFIMVFGIADVLNGYGAGILLWGGLALVLLIVFLWFRGVVTENRRGLYNAQVDRTFRLGMGWFIFSEVMFFGAFFGALFYARVLSNAWLGGDGVGGMTNLLLWPGYDAIWPTNGPAGMGGDFQPMAAWGLPAINTLILLTSGVTVTYAHHALKKNHRGGLIGGLSATVALGFLFVYLQMVEYQEAYHHLNLTLESGVYGSTFFMLTGFHGLHVTLGAIMLAVVLLRYIAGHFTADNHFAFEAAAWYWHFVDVVWLGLFVFVYWL